MPSINMATLTIPGVKKLLNIQLFARTVIKSGLIQVRYIKIDTLNNTAPVAAATNVFPNCCKYLRFFFGTVHLIQPEKHYGKVQSPQP